MRDNGGSSGAAAPSGAWWSTALQVVYPRACIGCDLPGTNVCRRCRTTCSSPRQSSIDGLPVVAAAHYDGIVREIILAAKSRGVTAPLGQVGGVWRTVLAPLVRRVLDGIGSDSDQPMIMFVPIPEKHRGGGRGFSVPVILASAAGVRTTRLLRWTRTVADQKSLTQRERQLNLKGALECTRVPTSDERAVIVVIDDVLTTGATLREARRALQRAGWAVIAASVFAMSQPRGADEYHGFPAIQDDTAGSEHYRM